jgi:phage-related holin
MKSIIYNLLKQSYDFFAVALTTGFIFSFFFPIKHFLLFTIGVVIADTITGIKAAKKEGKAITSKGLYRTTEKIVVYFTSILIFHGAQLLLQSQYLLFTLSARSSLERSCSAWQKMSSG